MPFFAWKGVDISGMSHTGTLSAIDANQLSKRLLDKQIALISYKTKRRWFTQPSLANADRVRLFDTLALLISSGVSLPQALALCADQMRCRLLQDAVVAIAHQLYEGHSLSKSCLQYPLIFNALAIQLVQAGEESGNLAAACKEVSHYYQMMYDCYRTIRKALLMPFITLLFFMATVLFMVMIIVPKFVQLYQSSNQPLPASTKLLYDANLLLQSWYVLPLILLGICSCVVLKRCLNQVSKKYIERLIFMLPGIRTLLVLHMRNYFFQACAFLLHGGIPLTKALVCIQKITDSPIMQQLLDQLIQDIMEGNALSNALMSSHAQLLFDAESMAIIQAGQESGTLARSCTILAQRYHERLMERIAALSTLIQPCAIVGLGLLIAFLLLSLYLPIFSLSSSYSV